MPGCRATVCFCSHNALANCQGAQRVQTHATRVRLQQPALPDVARSPCVYGPPTCILRDCVLHRWQRRIAALCSRGVRTDVSTLLLPPTPARVASGHVMRAMSGAVIQHARPAGPCASRASSLMAWSSHFCTASQQAPAVRPDSTAILQMLQRDIPGNHFYDYRRFCKTRLCPAHPERCATRVHPLARPDNLQQVVHAPKQS